MKILHLYRIQNVNGTETQRKVEHIRENFCQIKSVLLEYCFNVGITGDKLSIEDERKLKWLLSDPVRGEHDGQVREESSFDASDDKILIEIGPRLNFSTPFSTNAVSVCKSIGLTCVKRVEKSYRYLLDLVREDTNDDQIDELKIKLTEILRDRMTECVYVNKITSFDHGIKPEPWYEVDVLKEGRRALDKINEELGLSLDEWDIRFYTELFAKINRNPTSVECFDLAQSNSEHSRHWFFKGILKIDGTPVQRSLFKMIMDTQRTSNKNNVIKFNDNSSAIEGFVVPTILAENTSAPSTFYKKETQLHLIFTAETHNFPTAVSPFSGAATGTGGRIRDVQGVGRGGHTLAGTVGYSVGSLFIPGYKLPWEKERVADRCAFAKPLEILIEASNGCSDYGNKFGEPVICGFTRSFGTTNCQNQKIEYIKPILFSGGIGTVNENMVFKRRPTKGMKVIKIGGPVYRIGVGGGSASSTTVQGDNKVELDFNAVQRGDPEMEQKLNRLVRGCIECENDSNPIQSIHDQGAGGNGNVLKELVEPEGAVIFAKAFELGDDSVSTLELWGAEYQENNAVLCDASDVAIMKEIAHRERCPINVVGTVTGCGQIILSEGDIDDGKFINGSLPVNEKYPVNLDLKLVLGDVPKKEFKLISTPCILKTLTLPHNLQISELFHMVLRHPSVCSKRFLTNKVDRSVTGLIARQQCVGPLHTPVADVAVTAISYFNLSGIASSIGEQPIKGLLNPAAGARMSVAEALSNLVFAKISSLQDVKCSGNWMWPAKLDGEGVNLYRACEAMCSIMEQLGIAVDGGKDSLSMATRLRDGEVVKSPGTLVISTYAPCPDIRKIITPDLKSPWMSKKGFLLHVDVSEKKRRLGGSILAQCWDQLGHIVPDIDDAAILKSAFNVTQQLIEKKKILSGHDVSDGGLATCLVEMAISGLCGLCVTLNGRLSSTSIRQSAVEVLFAEECGWVLECEANDVSDIVTEFRNAGVLCSPIGFTESTGMDAKIQIMYDGEIILDYKLHELSAIWEETSYQIEKLQANVDCIEEEYRTLPYRKMPPYRYSLPLNPLTVLPTTRKESHVVVLREEGLNGDREMVASLYMAGFQVWDVTMQDLLDGKITLHRFCGVVFPGGFSYADVLGAAKGWAASVLHNETLREQFKSFYRRPDTFSFGVCNGCQLMCLINWVGNVDNNEDVTPAVILRENLSGRFESRFSTVKISKSPSIMLRNMENSILGVWVAHGEGRFTYTSNDVKDYLAKSNCIAIEYVDDEGEATERYPFNPNGSSGGVAGICSPDGRHLAMMPHPERCIKLWQWPYVPQVFSKDEKLKNDSQANADLLSPWFRIFTNAYEWCQQTVDV